MAGITLKVSTSVMTAKAKEILQETNTIEKRWKQMVKLIENSKTYWEGTAGIRHRNSIKDDKEDMETIVKRLKEHPKELLNMAGVYVKAEEKAEEMALALPKDVIK